MYLSNRERDRHRLDLVQQQLAAELTVAQTLFQLGGARSQGGVRGSQAGELSVQCVIKYALLLGYCVCTVCIVEECVYRSAISC